MRKEKTPLVMTPLEPSRTNGERFAEIEAKLAAQGEEIAALNDAVARLINIIESAKAEHQQAQEVIANRSRIVLAR